MTEKQEETCENCGKTKVLHYKKYSQLRCFDRDFNFAHSEGEYKWVFTPGKKFTPKNHSPQIKKSPVKGPLKTFGSKRGNDNKPFEDTPSGNIELLPRDKQKEGTQNQEKEK